MISRKITLIAALCLFAATARAQDDAVFIQIEARTSLAGAQESLQGFVRTLPDVNGFAMGGGWYGVALGPYSREAAERLLRELRRAGSIPPDSYIETPQVYTQQFWPVGAQVLQGAVTPVPVPGPVPQPAAQAPETAAPQAAAPAAEPAPEPLRDESPREARASEEALTRPEREELQIALKWAGFYTAGIDGAFGRGTRNAMGDWQRARGFEVTGILTTRQRAALLGEYYAVLEGMDLRRVEDRRAGIAMDLPTGVVAFDRYEAPFALYEPTGDLQARVLLVSQPGDRGTMNGLYEIMQTLEIVPLEGERRRDADGFLLTGANDRIVSHTEVGLRDGALKGFTLIWPAGDEERRQRVLGLMRTSFERLDGVLDPATVTDEGQQVDLVSGMKIRQPVMTASGFFVDNAGTVLTTAAAVAGCSRVTLDGVHEARVVARDEALGLAVLKPQERLAPRNVASFRTDTPRLQSEVAVAGYSFGGILRAPTLTFGTLEDTRGLAGEESLKRLAMATQPGDAGGPVFDAGGTVLGMLLPRVEDGVRRLPDAVNFAADAEAVLAFLRGTGLQPVTRGGAGVMAPEDLTALATEMTVLVSCWE